MPDFLKQNRYMKKRKIKKMVKALAEEMKRYDGGGPKKIKIEEPREDYCQAASEKFKKMALSLMSQCDGLSIRAEDSGITISCTDITKAMIAPSSQPTALDDNSLEIMVDREGFSVNLGWTKVARYKDPGMLGEILPTAKEKQRKINLENFGCIWETIMKKSGAIRGKNLDEIL